MRIRTVLFLMLLGLILSTCGNKSSQEEGAPAPNIIYILADDLGYGDIGAYGQQLIETPNLDALAAGGMLFTQHYSSAPVCAPARYMFLTGKHSGHAFIRGNDEWNDRGDVWDYEAMAKDSTLEGQRPMPENEILLSHRLQQVGYRTGLFGKWGLGAPHTQSVPNKMGFDTFFGYNCQRQAHTYHPLFLYSDMVRVSLENDTIPPHSGLDFAQSWLKQENGDPYAVFQQGEYAPDRIYQALEEFIGGGQEQPFFAYWATPIPHVPLQAPEDWINYYRKKLGEEQPHEGGKAFGYFPQRYPRATYAAMISYLDAQVGRLIDYLKAKGLYENTLIFFTSDNGPSYAGGADPEFFNSAGPFDGNYGRGKGFVYEGGIRIPLIASWPGHIAPGSRNELPTVHYDMFATLGELTGYDVPEVVDGESFLSSLIDDGDTIQNGIAPGLKPPLIWAFPEYGGQMALRQGDWKLLQRGLNKPEENPGWELYNLREDPTETRNVAREHPEILDSLLRLMEREYERPATDKFRLKEFEARIESGTRAER